MSGKKMGKTRRIGSSRRERQGLGRMRSNEDMEPMEEEPQALVERKDVGSRQEEDSFHESSDIRAPYREPNSSHDLHSADQLHHSLSAVLAGLESAPLSVTPESSSASVSIHSAEQSMTTEETVIATTVTQADVTQVEAPTDEDSRTAYLTTAANTVLPEHMSNPEPRKMERRRKLGSSHRISQQTDVWRHGGVEWEVTDRGEEKTKKEMTESPAKLLEEKVTELVTGRAEGHHGHSEEGREDPALVESLHAEQPAYKITSPDSEFQVQNVSIGQDWCSTDSVVEHCQQDHSVAPQEKEHMVGAIQQKKKRIASTRKTGLGLQRERHTEEGLGDFGEEILADLNEILRGSKYLGNAGGIQVSEEHKETNVDVIKDINIEEDNKREMSNLVKDNEIQETKQEGVGEEEESQAVKEKSSVEDSVIQEISSESLLKDDETCELNKEERGLAEENGTKMLKEECLVGNNKTQALEEQGPKTDDKIQIIKGLDREQSDQSGKQDTADVDISKKDVSENEETAKIIPEIKAEKRGYAPETQKVLDEEVSVTLFGDQAEGMKYDQSLQGSSSVGSYKKEGESLEKENKSHMMLHQTQDETFTVVSQLKISPLLELTAAQNLALSLNADHILDNVYFKSTNNERPSVGNETTSPTFQPPYAENFQMEDRQLTPGKRRKMGSTRKNIGRQGLDKAKEGRPEVVVQHQGDKGGMKEEIRSDGPAEGAEAAIQMCRGEVPLEKHLIKKEKKVEDPDNKSRVDHEGEGIEGGMNVGLEISISTSLEKFEPQDTEHNLYDDGFASFQSQSKAEDAVTEEASASSLVEQNSKIHKDISSALKKTGEIGSFCESEGEMKKWQEEEERKHFELTDTGSTNAQDEKGAESPMELREDAEEEMIEGNVKTVMAKLEAVSSEYGQKSVEEMEAGEEKWYKFREKESVSVPMEFSGSPATKNNKDTGDNSFSLTGNSGAAGSSTDNLSLPQRTEHHQDSSPRSASSIGKRRKMGSSRRGGREWHKEQETEEKTIPAAEDAKVKEEESAKQGKMTEVLMSVKEEQKHLSSTDEGNPMENFISVSSIPGSMTIVVGESATTSRQPEDPNVQVAPLHTARRRKMGSRRKEQANLGKEERELEWSKGGGDANITAALQRILEVFSQSSLKDKQFITLLDVQALSAELGPSDEELQQVFRQLDQNLGGLMTPQDFTRSLQDIVKSKATPISLVHQSHISGVLVELDGRLLDMERPGGQSFLQNPTGSPGPPGHGIVGLTGSEGRLLSTEENAPPGPVTLSHSSHHWQEGQALWEREADHTSNAATGSLSKHQESGVKKGVEQLREEVGSFSKNQEERKEQETEQLREKVGLLSKDQQSVHEKLEEHLGEEPLILGRRQGGLSQLWSMRETVEGGENDSDSEGENRYMTEHGKREIQGEKEDWEGNLAEGAGWREEHNLKKGGDEGFWKVEEERDEKMIVQEEKQGVWVIEGSEGREEKVIKGGEPTKEWNVDMSQRRMEKAVEGREEKEELSVVDSEAMQDEVVKRREGHHKEQVAKEEEKMEEQIVNGGEEMKERVVKGGKKKEDIEKESESEEQLVKGGVEGIVEKEEQLVEENLEQVAEEGEEKLDLVVKEGEQWQEQVLDGGEEKKEQVGVGNEEMEEQLVEGGSEHNEQLVKGTEEEEEILVEKGEEGGEKSEDQWLDGNEEEGEQVVNRIERKELKVERGKDTEKQIVEGNKEEEEQVMEEPDRNDKQLIEGSEENEEQVMGQTEQKEEEEEQVLEGGEEKDKQMVEVEEEEEQVMEKPHMNNEQVMEGGKEKEGQLVEGGEEEEKHGLKEDAEKEEQTMGRIEEKEKRFLEGGEEKEKQTEEGNEKDQLVEENEEEEEQVVEEPNGTNEQVMEGGEGGEEKEEQLVEGGADEDKQALKEEQKIKQVIGRIEEKEEEYVKEKEEEQVAEGGEEMDKQIVAGDEEKVKKVLGEPDVNCEQIMEGSEEKEEQLMEGDEEKKQIVGGREKKMEQVMEGDEMKGEQVVVGTDVNDEQVVDKGEEKQEQLVEGDKQLVVGDGEERKHIVKEDEEKQVLKGIEAKEEHAVEGGEKDKLLVERCEEQEEQVVQGEEEKEEWMIRTDEDKKKQLMEGSEEKKEQFEYSSQTTQTDEEHEDEMETPHTDSRWLHNTWELQQGHMVYLRDTLEDLRSTGRYELRGHPCMSMDNAEDHEWVWDSELLEKQRSFSVEEEKMPRWNVWAETEGDAQEWMAEREGFEQEGEMADLDVLFWGGWEEQTSKKKISQSQTNDLYPILEENEAESELKEDIQKHDQDASHSQLKTASGVTGTLEEVQLKDQVQSMENKKDEPRSTDWEGGRKPAEPEAETMQTKDDRGGEEKLVKVTEQRDAKVGTTEKRQRNQKKWEISELGVQINREEKSERTVKENEENIKIIYSELQEKDSENGERERKKAFTKKEAEDWVAETDHNEGKKRDREFEKMQDITLEVDIIETEKAEQEVRAEQTTQQELDRNGGCGIAEFNKCQLNKEDGETGEERSTTIEVLIEGCEEEEKLAFWKSSQTLTKENIINANEISEKNQQRKPEIKKDHTAASRKKTTPMEGQNLPLRNDLNKDFIEQKVCSDHKCELEKNPSIGKMKWLWSMEMRDEQYRETEGEVGTAERYGETEGQPRTAEGYGETEGQLGTAEGSGETEGQLGTVEGYGETKGEVGTADGYGETGGQLGTVEGYGETKGEVGTAEGYGETEGQLGTGEGYGETEGEVGTAERYEGTEGQLGTAEGYGETERQLGTAEGFRETEGQLAAAEGSGETEGDMGTAEGYGEIEGQLGTGEGYGETEGQLGTAEGCGETEGQLGTGEGYGETEGQLGTAEGCGETKGEVGTAEGYRQNEGQLGTAEGYGETEGQLAAAEGSGETKGEVLTAEGYGETEGQLGITERYGETEREVLTAERYGETEGQLGTAEGYGETEGELGTAEGYGRTKGKVLTAERYGGTEKEVLTAEGYGQTEGQLGTAEEYGETEGEVLTAERYGETEGELGTGEGYGMEEERGVDMGYGDVYVAEPVDWFSKLNPSECIYFKAFSELPDESRKSSLQHVQNKVEASEELTVTEVRDQDSFAVVGSDGNITVDQDAENTTVCKNSRTGEPCQTGQNLGEEIPCPDLDVKGKETKGTEAARMEVKDGRTTENKDLSEISLSESQETAFMVLCSMDDLENELSTNERRHKACDSKSQVEKPVVMYEDIAAVKVTTVTRVEEAFNSETEKHESAEWQITGEDKMWQEGEKLEQVVSSIRKTSEKAQEDKELRRAAMQIYEEIEQETRQELMGVREAQQREGEEENRWGNWAMGEGGSVVLQDDGQRALGCLPAGEWTPPTSDPDLLYNVVLVGNSSVGKTSFMKRFQSGEMSLDHCATIGLDSCIQATMIDGQRVLLQLWDTAGQERYHSITKQILRKAQGLLLMYDITSSESFRGIRYWMSCIEEGAPNDTVMMLLGNKNDSPRREVPRDDGQRLAAEFSIPFMECSAASGDNVVHSMETLARMLKQHLDQKNEPPLVLHKEEPKKSFGCC